MMEEYRLEIGEGRAASAPDIMRSGGLGPCIAIAAYDPRTRSGYMVHEPAPGKQELAAFVQVVENAYGGLERVRVFAAGGALDPYPMLPELTGMIDESRKIVEDALRKRFGRRARFSWGECELFLDLKRGRFNVEH